MTVLMAISHRSRRRNDNMTRKLNDFLQTFTPAEQAKIQARASALIEEELTLRALRQAHNLTQERMAELLGVKQENISRMERRADLLLSTMSSYIEAMGGKLKLVAEFPERQPVVIKNLADIGLVENQAG
jgi:DNA-binding XRE family transcriptional regulator